MALVSKDIPSGYPAPRGTYFREFLANWRALAAASIGLSAGTSTNYIGNIFTPHLITAFGWSRADLSLIGVTILLAAVCLPIGGRLADVLGVRLTASIGVVSAPLIFVALSMMQGEFLHFFLLNVLQVVLVTCTVSVTVYTRLISSRFDRARGLALGIASCAPALAAMIGVPILSSFIDANGWRAGYLAVAVCVALGGLGALLLIPARTDAPRRSRLEGGGARKDYGEIVRNPAFAVIMGGIVLCNLPITMHTTQLKVVLLDIGVSPETGTWLISLYALGVIIGRFVCGVALDRWPAYLIATFSLGLPCLGLSLLALGVSSSGAAALAVLLIGLSIGAEGDVAAYLVMKYFKPQVYSSVLGLVTGAMAVSGAGGALLLNTTLKATGGYTTFLVLSTGATLIGACVFLRLRGLPNHAPASDGEGREWPA